MAKDDIRVNLKRLLMEFGNRLVTDLKFDPSGYMPAELKHELKANHTTEPITMLAMWINEHPEAQEILKEMGVDWPM